MSDLYELPVGVWFYSFNSDILKILHSFLLYIISSSRCIVKESSTIISELINYKIMNTWNTFF